MTQIVSLEDRRKSDRSMHRRTYFSRPELMQLLNLYSRRVARGEWRDYAIDHQPSMAMFSVFRSSYERPLYIIAKTANGGRNGLYILFEGRHKLRQEKQLSEILEYLDRKLELVSG